jgi:hypothetical protein
MRVTRIAIPILGTLLIVGVALIGLAHDGASAATPELSDLSSPPMAHTVAPTTTAAYTATVFLPLVMRPSAPVWITGTYQGLYSLCQNAAGVTSTLQGLGGFTMAWDDTGGGASAGLGDPLGNTWDCRSVMVFAFPPDALHGRVVSGSMDLSNAWTTVQNKHVQPQDVQVGLRQTNWTRAPADADPRALWFDVKSETWTQSLPSFQGLCFHTSVFVPPGQMVVGGPEVGLMVYSSAVDRSELWQQDFGRFVDYGHYLTWGGSCPGPKPTLRLLIEPEVIH